jgi:alpha-glucosidase
MTLSLPAAAEPALAHGTVLAHVTTSSPAGRTEMSRATISALALVGLALAAHVRAATDADSLTLQSPGKRVEIQFASTAEGIPTYAVSFGGQMVIAPSPLGMQLDKTQGGLLAEGLKRTGTSPGSADNPYTLIVGKTRNARDRYEELTLSYQESKDTARKLDIIFRAYDDGVAFRYRLPQQPGLDTVTLNNELTHFSFPTDYDCWALNLGRFGTSHEGEFDSIRASRIRPQHLIELPLVCKTGQNQTTLAIAEADLKNYAGLYLNGRGDGGLGVEARLSPRLDDPRVAVRAPMTPNGVYSPWRVIMLADQPGRLIESTLITNLNPDPASRDLSWIKPGKSAWDWWSGPLAAGINKPGMNNATMKYYIDFASKMGLQYMLIDDGWYVNSGGAGDVRANTDITRAIPEIDLPGLVKYAADRKIGLFVWVHWKPIDDRMDEALAFYERTGIKGIKVDFMDRDDQEMVEFYHRLMQKTAEHHLLLDLHGAYRPTGLVRTYPHYLTQEGVMGAEYNKWSRRVTATHNVTLPYTRMLLGPLDYTPGGFRNLTPETFQIKFYGPNVMTTRGQALAMFVVYESPFACVSDSPESYEGQDGAEFLKLVPTTWDETRFIAGDVGEYIVIARRHENDWYVGAMTNERARQVDVPLDFLGDGTYAATVWTDGASPTTLKKETRSLDRKSTAVPLALAAGGGAVIHFQARSTKKR